MVDTGVVVVWNAAVGLVYVEGISTNLIVSPTDSATWHNDPVHRKKYFSHQPITPSKQANGELDWL